MNFPVLTMSQVGDTTQFDILGSILSSSDAKPIHLEYMNTSYVSFVLNSSILQQLLSTLSPLGLSKGVMPSLPTMSAGSGSTIYGELHTQDNGRELVMSFRAE